MTYDAIIIGSGQAGTPLAVRLADRGWSVALIEQAHLGGTCVNTGCTPTKTLVERAHVAHHVREAARWGVHASDVGVDLPRVLAQKNDIVGRARHGLERKVAERSRLRLLTGQARFESPRQVRVGQERLESGRIFIDTGQRPRIPEIPGLESVPFLTNESLLDLDTLPDHLLVLGAGAVGLEFAQVFARFGSRVTVIHDAGQILPREDSEIAAELQRALESEGIAFRLNAHARAVEGGEGRITLTVETGIGAEAIEGSHLLVATGRRPNTDALQLERAGIEIDGRGYIRVNAKLETSVPGIWALGDVNGGPAFTHISYHDFQIVYGNLVEGRDLGTEDRIVPYAVFTDPELGRVGLTEREARARHYRLKIGTVPISSVSRAIERDETAGLMKLVVNADDDRVLGASLLGPDGAEVVQILSALMMADQPYTLLRGAIYIHPTMAEGLFALMEAVKPAGAASVAEVRRA